MPAFVRAVLASRPGTFDEICLFEPDPGRRDTICRLASGIATALGHPDTVTVTADAAEAFAKKHTPATGVDGPLDGYEALGKLYKDAGVAIHIVKFGNIGDYKKIGRAHV